MGNGSGTNGTLTPTQQATDRADFMKRFFAIAISIGFASQLDKAFAWASAFRWPSSTELGVDCLLICAIIVSIGSWEAYFKSLKNTPLNDWPRFYSDVATVSLYVLLFKSVSNFDAFRLYLVLIYINYVIWNVLSIHINPVKYDISDRSFRSVSGLFFVGFTSWGKNSKVRGPFLVLFWLIVICMSMFLHELLNTPVFWAALMLATSHIIYRMDLGQPFPMWQRCARAAMVLGLVAVGTIFIRGLSCLLAD